jgi:hypothetical protein
MKRIGVILTLCVLLFSGCGRAKVQAKYGGSAGTKTNNAGTLSVVLPIDVPGKEGADTAAGGTGISKETGPSAGGIVEIKEKMFIAQTNDVYLNPEDYLGKTIKLEGLFKSEQGFDNQQPYCFVLRYGPGCCGTDGNAGFEVAWDETEPAEKLYPAEDDWVEATGVLKTYEEDGYPYLYLALSSLRVLEEKGAEFVTQ